MAFWWIFSVGYEELETMISCARIESAIVCLYPSISNSRVVVGSCSLFLVSCSPTSSRNLRTLIDARLQALSSRCMYSEQGLEALIGPVFEHVCQSLIAVSYCMPGSAHSQAAWAMSRISFRALYI